MAGFEAQPLERPASRADRRVAIADTTIRDEHLLGADPRLLADRDLSEVWRSCALGVEQRIAVGRQLAALGVDVIEAGFVEQPGGTSTAAALAAEFAEEGPVVSAQIGAFAGEAALGAATEAVSKARRPRVHVHVSTADLVDEHGQFRRHPALLLDQAMGAIAALRAAVEDIEFSPPRTDLGAVGIAAAWTRAAIDAGVRTINLRYCTDGPEPDEFLALLAELRRLAAPPAGVVLSADIFAPDLSTEDAYVASTACAEAALAAGCGQVKCAFHGIAGTPGHAALEMVAFQLWLRRRLEESHLSTGIDTTRLLEASRVIAETKGVDLPPSQPLLGEDFTSPSLADFPTDPTERILTAAAVRIVLEGLGVSVPPWLDEFANPSTL